MEKTFKLNKCKKNSLWHVYKCKHFNWGKKLTINKNNSYYKLLSVKSVRE